MPLIARSCATETPLRRATLASDSPDRTRTRFDARELPEPPERTRDGSGTSRAPATVSAVGIRSKGQAEFVAPAYYMSMGFAVPASIGVALARPDLRPYVVVGDGVPQLNKAQITDTFKDSLMGNTGRDLYYASAITTPVSVKDAVTTDVPHNTVIKVDLV